MSDFDRRFYQESIVATIRFYDPPLYGVWGERLMRALMPVELDRRSRAVIRAALDAVVHPEMAVIERHVNAAFDEGSNIAEMLESMMSVGCLEAGGHGVHDGIEAVGNVIERRMGAGLPTPRAGAAMLDEDHVALRFPSPPRFPAEARMPHFAVMEKFDPELWAAYSGWNELRLRIRKGLTRRMEERIVIAVDSAVRWRFPLIDLHVHGALNIGASVQELVEVVMTCADADQGARDSNLSGRRLADGVEIVRFGLAALDRVIMERKSAAIPTAYDRVPVND